MSKLEVLLIVIVIFVVANVIVWALKKRGRTTDDPTEEGIRHRVFAAYTLARAKNCILAEAPPYLGLDALASFLNVSYSSRSMKGAKEELYRVYPGDIADTVEKLLTGDVWSDQVDAAAGGRRY